MEQNENKYHKSEAPAATAPGDEQQQQQQQQQQSHSVPQHPQQKLQYSSANYDPNCNSEALLSHYEAEMRGHAVAYASAAANAAWVAAMVAQQRATEASHLAAQLMMQSQQYQHPAIFGNTPQNTLGQYQYNYKQAGCHHQNDQLVNGYNENDDVHKKRCKTNGNFHRRRKQKEGAMSVNESSSNVNNIHWQHQNNQQQSQQNHNRDRKKKKRVVVSVTYNSNQPELPKNKVRKNSNNISSFNASLAGKTGVCALYELCSKKRWGVPRFICIATNSSTNCNKVTNTSSTTAAVSDCSSISSVASGSCGALQFHEYIIEVEIGGRVFGRGRAGTKATARQDAARQAIISLLPGAAFDVNGALVDMSKFHHHSGSPAPSSLDASSIHSEHSSIVSDSRILAPYQNQGGENNSGVSSMSEDDDSYFSSRGASACSGLLHTMWQIDERIIEAPRFSYDLCQPTNSLSSACQSHTSTPQHRPSFACTARVILDHDKKGNDCELCPDTIPDKSGLEELVAVGTSTIKKESKHIASAKLLSMLFPHCQSTIDAMAAAEAMKEKYATKRANERQSKKHKSNTSKLSGSIEHAALKLSDPLPQSVRKYLCEMSRNEVKKKTPSFIKATSKVEEASSNIHADNTIGVATLSISEPNESCSSDESNLTKTDDRSPSGPKLSPQTCVALNDQIDEALQLLELDEEGRASCQSNPDDIGRMMLRRAHSSDHDQIIGLRRTRNTNDSPTQVSREDPILLVSPNIEQQNEAKKLWGDNVVVAVLSRALLNKSSPIMGFAVLSLQLSPVKGRILSLSELCFAEHLPRERFLESLTHLSSLMGIELVDDYEPKKEIENGWVVIDNDSIRDVLDKIPRHKSSTTRVMRKSPRKCEIKTLPLQSITEKDEEHHLAGGSENGVNNRQNVQPTKRSRVS